MNTFNAFISCFYCEKWGNFSHCIVQSNKKTLSCSIILGFFFKRPKLPTFDLQSHTERVLITMNACKLNRSRSIKASLNDSTTHLFMDMAQFFSFILKSHQIEVIAFVHAVEQTKGYLNRQIPIQRERKKTK